MSTLEQMEALQAAVSLLKIKRASLAGASDAVWRKLYNAVQYLDKQMQDCLTME